jgi:hypothetical protein
MKSPALGVSREQRCHLGQQHHVAGTRFVEEGGAIRGRPLQRVGQDGLHLQP